MVGSIWPGKRQMSWALTEEFLVELCTFDLLDDWPLKKVSNYRNLLNILIFAFKYIILQICMEIVQI